MLRTIFGTTTSRLQSERFLPVDIPLLSEIPLVGIIFQQSVLTYIGILLVPVVYVIFFKTNWGLKIRAVGENPKAAETMGVNVSRIRYISILWAATFVAIGGASTTIGDIGYFTENITAGRGFIAFAAVILGRFHPIGTLITVLFFGMVDAFQLNLQATGVPIPYQFPLMLPYLLTLIAFLIAGSGVAPKSWGVPYVAEE
jgi:simple sugar transport system permease protein